MKIRVYYENTDAAGVVYHSNYINFCERARSEAFLQAGVDLFCGTKHFVVSQINAKFIKPSFLCDILEVKTTVETVKKASAVMKQEIYKIQDAKGNKYNQLVFEATVHIAYTDQGKPIKMQDDVIKFLQNIKSIESA